eukprot:9261-Heterococcus_DN1.PRE.1
MALLRKSNHIANINIRRSTETQRLSSILILCIHCAAKGQFVVPKHTVHIRGRQTLELMRDAKDVTLRGQGVTVRH